MPEPFVIVVPVIFTEADVDPMRWPRVRRKLLKTLKQTVSEQMTDKITARGFVEHKRGILPLGG